MWAARALAQRVQAGLSQRAATRLIGDLSAQVLRAVTALPPHRLHGVRDEATVVLTRGLDGLRPYFTGYLPAVILAGILTPATVVVIAATDLQSAAVVAVALPLIPLFMVLIGKLTADRSAAALTAMTTLQSRLLDLVAGIPTLRALGRAAGPAHRIAELSAAHRRSAMQTLRIAFLSAAVLELIATLGVALVAVSVGLRLVFGEMTSGRGIDRAAAGPGGVLAAAPGGRAVPCRPGRQGRRRCGAAPVGVRAVARPPGPPIRRSGTSRSGWRTCRSPAGTATPPMR